MRKIDGVRLFFALAGLLLLSGPASAQVPEKRGGHFNVKVSYSRWDLTGSSYMDGLDGDICPPWPWPLRWPPRRPWPPPWPPPWWDFHFGDYRVHEGGLTRVTPLELGVMFPLSSATRVTPYIGAGMGYYLLHGDSPNAKDKFGAYGALGVNIHVGERWGLSLEGSYRNVGGKIDLDGPALKAGLGISF